MALWGGWVCRFYFMLLTDLLSTLRITTCVSSQVQSTIPRQPVERAKGIVKAEKEDLFNVVTLKRGKQSSREPPASTTHRVTWDQSLNRGQGYAHLSSPGQGVHSPLTHDCLGFSLILWGGLARCWNCVKSVSRSLVPSSGALSFSQQEIPGGNSLPLWSTVSDSQMERHKCLFRTSACLPGKLQFWSTFYV